MQVNWPPENRIQRCFKSDLSLMPLVTSCFEDSSLLACEVVSAGEYLPTFRKRAMFPHSNKHTPERVVCLAPRMKELQTFKTTVTVYIRRHVLISEKPPVFSNYSIITANLVFWARILFPRNGGIFDVHKFKRTIYLIVQNAVTVMNSASCH